MTVRDVAALVRMGVSISIVPLVYVQNGFS
jgi:hypothetical protein